jgi:hypothetical protein
MIIWIFSLLQVYFVVRVVLATKLYPDFVIIIILVIYGILCSSIAYIAWRATKCIVDDPIIDI